MENDLKIEIEGQEDPIEASEASEASISDENTKEDITDEEKAKQVDDGIKEAQEKKMEEIVINAREKVYPLLKEKNLTINESKYICEVLANVVLQGQYTLLKEHKVEDLKLTEIIKTDYPHADIIIEIIKAINCLSMEMGVQSLQWLTEKIKKVVEDEYKDKKFTDLMTDF